MIVAWTGHRPDLFGDIDAARRAVDRAAHDLKQQGAQRFVVGGQRGVDTWAALAALRQKIPFTIILPFPPTALDEFTRDWPAADCAVLEDTIKRAAEVQVASGYSDRNRQLATAADLLVAVWTGIGGGGTEETLAFARQARIPIREIVLGRAPNAHSASRRGI